MILRILLLIILIIVIVLLILKYSKHTKESFSDYLKCLQKGFTKTFCVMNNPSPDACLCDNGNVGRIIPGFKGECVCGPESILVPKKEEIEIAEDTTSIPRSLTPNSYLHNYEYKRSALKNVEDVIPFAPFGNFSFF